MGEAKTRLKENNSFYRVVVSAADQTGIQFFRYFFTGGAAALVDWFFYWLFYSAGLHYLLAALLSFTLATFVNYSLCVKWVFARSRHRKSLEVGLVFFVSLVGLFFNELTLFIIMEYSTVHFMAAKIIATGVAFFWNFFARKKYIFM